MKTFGSAIAYLVMGVATYPPSTMVVFGEEIQHRNLRSPPTSSKQTMTNMAYEVAKKQRELKEESCINTVDDFKKALITDKESDILICEDVTLPVNEPTKIVIDYNVNIVCEGSASSAAKFINNGGKKGLFDIKSGSNVLIDNCTFQNFDSSRSNGGVINAQSSSQLTLLESTFENCKGLYGGAIYCKGCTLDIESSLFVKSIAFVDGGAVSGDRSSRITIVSSIFDANESNYGRGGAVACTADSGSAAHCEIDDSNFSNNRANRNGGGAIVVMVPSMTEGMAQPDPVPITNSDFSNNYGATALKTKEIVLSWFTTPEMEKEILCDGTQFAGNSFAPGAAPMTGAECA